jgi:hypothetical protein
MAAAGPQALRVVSGGGAGKTGPKLDEDFARVCRQKVIVQADRDVACTVEEALKLPNVYFGLQDKSKGDVDDEGKKSRQKGGQVFIPQPSPAIKRMETFVEKCSITDQEVCRLELIIVFKTWVASKHPCTPPPSPMAVQEVCCA